MRTLQVQFSSGREVLGRYWGMLHGGGLTFDLPQELPQRTLDSKATPVSWPGISPAEVLLGWEPGEELQLEIHICSIKKTFHLAVQLMDVRQSESGAQAVVAFLPDHPPDEMLDAVWADGFDVPQRRSRRLRYQAEVRYDCLNVQGLQGQVGRLVNLSAGGCCVTGTALPPRDTQLLLTIVLADPQLPQLGEQDIQVVGRVRWTERPEGGFMGIEFLSPVSSKITELVQELSLSHSRPGLD